MQARLAALVGVSFAGFATPAQGMAPAMRRSLQVVGSSLILLALFAANAKALTIPINPGPIGGPADEFSWQTDDDFVTFDIEFTDGKALEWGPGTKVFRLLSAVANGEDFFGAFLDAAGEVILGTAFVGQFGTDLSPGNVAVAVLDEQVVFHGMRFIAFDPVLLQSAYQVRWVNDDAPTVVPEPSTALLLSLGLLGVGIRRRRAAEPQPL